MLKVKFLIVVLSSFFTFVADAAPLVKCTLQFTEQVDSGVPGNGKILSFKTKELELNLDHWPALNVNLSDFVLNDQSKNPRVVTLDDLKGSIASKGFKIMLSTQDHNRGPEASLGIDVEIEPNEVFSKKVHVSTSYTFRKNQGHFYASSAHIRSYDLKSQQYGLSISAGCDTTLQP